MLVVDGEAKVRKLIADSLRGTPVTLLQAGSLAEARRQLAQGPVDLALIDPDLPDGSGIDLTGELSGKRSATQTIVITHRPSVERAIEAMRAGAVDLLVKPLKSPEIGDRVRRAIARHRSGRRDQQRIDRLRRICKKLTAARQEVGQQVDVLCNDLVNAYQELATQVHQVAQTGEFVGLMRNELDLEHMLRKTLEYVLQKAGPTNAAIFLPSSSDEYSLGGYVNYDCTSESADILLQHLADVVAAKIAEHDGPLQITDNPTLAQWIGDDAAYLADSHVLAFPCRHEAEALAVVILFRDAGEPFQPDLVEACAAIAPLLAQHLARLIRIHHRATIDEDEAAA